MKYRSPNPQIVMVAHTRKMDHQTPAQKITNIRKDSFLDNLTHSNWTLCPLPYCTQKITSYNTFRDHFLTHTDSQIILDDLIYLAECKCQEEPIFQTTKAKRVHMYRKCKNAPFNLDLVLNTIIPYDWELPLDDEYEDTIPFSQPLSPLDGLEFQSSDLRESH